MIASILFVSSCFVHPQASGLRPDLQARPCERNVAGGTPAAHYVSALTGVSGIVVPTKHTILPRHPDGSSAPTPVVVSIDISEIEFR
jgi:hypothetical protein